MEKCRNVTSLCAVTVVFYTDRLPQSSRQPDEAGTPTNSILQTRGVEVLESPQLVQASALLGGAGLEALWSARGVALGTPADPVVTSARLNQDEAERLQQGDPAVLLVAEGEISGSLLRGLRGSREQGRSAEIPVPPEPGLCGLQGTAGT